MSEKSGLHTAPLVLQTASASPEAVCFELRHFCRRESLKTDPNAMWLVSPDVRSTYSEDGAVLLDIQKGLCYSLNPVAARVWSTVEASPSGVGRRGWKLTTQSPVSNSNVTSMSIYRSSKISGLFNGTACFTSPRPPARGVDMLRNTWSASVGTELSNAPAAWA